MKKLRQKRIDSLFFIVGCRCRPFRYLAFCA